ncbi:hypothetical protein SteCoe_18375 [Stentor coeruleus]|uniref:AP complex subunit sigma n=1 Tax=Stentor coeruleus TaxID=5963 RepID=A0A1R2BWL1_9CILI|nr:hypothetical protein SteCoe_18375 [Stentor coeruleus]
MIRFLVIHNKQGKIRLSRWYTTIPYEEKCQLERDVHRLEINRDPKYTNFLEFKNFKVVYRRYAGLFFSVGVDYDGNVLSVLEIIHLFVEVMDQYFGSVCELDLVFNFHKVYGILDEILIGGEITETSKPLILQSLRAGEK